MARKRKQEVKVNNTESLAGLMQETYNDACLQIIELQSTINELTNGTKPVEIVEHALIAKEKGALLKGKDSAIKIKLELAKLQAAIINNGGNAEAGVRAASGGQASTSDFSSIIKMIKQEKEDAAE